MKKYRENLKFSINATIGLSMLLTAACSNGLDLRGQHYDQHEESLAHSRQASSMALSEAASAVRSLKSQNMLDANEPVTVAHVVPTAQIVAHYAGRYTGQVPCASQSTQASQCAQEKIDIALTLLPDGSAVRTLVKQGKVNSMLEKETAVWTVAGNGETIMLILPNREVWSFKQAGRGKLRYEPNSSAALKDSMSSGSHQYVLTAANM
jgi:hypothetical protein